MGLFIVGRILTATEIVITNRSVFLFFFSKVVINLNLATIVFQIISTLANVLLLKSYATVSFRHFVSLSFARVSVCSFVRVLVCAWVLIVCSFARMLVCACLLEIRSMACPLIHCFFKFQLNRYLALPWLFWEILMLVYTFGLTFFFITIWHGVSDFY